MDNYMKLYWLTRIDDIKILIGLIILFLFIRAIFYCIDVDGSKGSVKQKRKWKIWAAVYFSIGGLLLSSIVFIPSKQDIIFIYAGGKTMDFVQSDTSLQKLPSQTTKLITDYLDKKIKEAK